MKDLCDEDIDKAGQVGFGGFQLEGGKNSKVAVSTTPPMPTERQKNNIHHVLYSITEETGLWRLPALKCSSKFHKND